MLTFGKIAALASVAAAAAFSAASAAPVIAANAMASAGVIGTLQHIRTIGSTIDPLNGDRNPYGLAIAPVTKGRLHAGDLVVCNFNDALNIQGLGTTLDVLRPVPGATPFRLLADPRLTGCASLVLGPTGNPWIAAYTANDNPIVGPDGTFLTALKDYPWTGPWGQTFSGKAGPHGFAAFYESNALDGSIVRINITNAGFTFDKIVTGFSVNHGVPGNILAPAGLSYDAVRDRLYIVDSNSNRVVSIERPGSVPAGGIALTAQGVTGPSARDIHVLFAGAPLLAPISSALLFNGNLVVGNTTDNRLHEFTPAGRLVGERLLDTGAPGALFGIAAGGTSAATTRIYFNDDNDNTVKVLAP